MVGWSSAARRSGDDASEPFSPILSKPKHLPQGSSCKRVDMDPFTCLAKVFATRLSYRVVIKTNFDKVAAKAFDISGVS
jgi:hypothetical protein